MAVARPSSLVAGKQQQLSFPTFVVPGILQVVGVASSVDLTLTGSKSLISSAERDIIVTDIVIVITAISVVTTPYFTADFIINTGAPVTIFTDVFYPRDEVNGNYRRIIQGRGLTVNSSDAVSLDITSAAVATTETADIYLLGVPL